MKTGRTLRGSPPLCIKPCGAPPRGSSSGLVLASPGVDRPGQRGCEGGHTRLATSSPPGKIWGVVPQRVACSGSCSERELANLRTTGPWITAKAPGDGQASFARSQPNRRPTADGILKARPSADYFLRARPSADYLFLCHGTSTVERSFNDKIHTVAQADP